MDILYPYSSLKLLVFVNILYRKCILNLQSLFNFTKKKTKKTHSYSSSMKNEILYKNIKNKINVNIRHFFVIFFLHSLIK